MPEQQDEGERALSRGVEGLDFLHRPRDGGFQLYLEQEGRVKRKTGEATPEGWLGVYGGRN